MEEKLNCKLCEHKKDCRFLNTNRKQYGFIKMITIKKELPYDCGSFRKKEIK